MLYKQTLFTKTYEYYITGKITCETTYKQATYERQITSKQPTRNYLQTHNLQGLYNRKIIHDSVEFVKGLWIFRINWQKEGTMYLIDKASK